jgi:hypothetical protein
LSGDNTSFGNPDAGWKAEETARLIGGAADIASAVSAWLPGYGTAASLMTGLGSTALNLFADIKDESVNGWDVWKNTGLNLMMDLAGLVPGGTAVLMGYNLYKSWKAVGPQLKDKDKSWGQKVGIIAATGITSALTLTGMGAGLGLNAQNLADSGIISPEAIFD